MATHFEEVDAQVQAELSDRLGVAMFFEGRTSSQYSEAADPERVGFEAVAVKALSPRSGPVSEGVSEASRVSQRLHTNSEIWISEAVWLDMPWILKAGDFVYFNHGEVNERTFLVLAIMPLNGGDVQVTLDERRATV